MHDRARTQPDHFYYGWSHEPLGVSTVRKLAGLVVLAVVLYALYAVQTRQFAYYEITSGSMSPTLKVGERWLMHKRSTYQRGDIVVLPEPTNPAVMLVKRLVAIGPDEIVLRDGKLHINGKRAAFPPGADDHVDDDTSSPDQTWRLDYGQGFVVGDNRTNSVDSRSFGPIQLDQIQGVLFERVSE